MISRKGLGTIFLTLLFVCCMTLQSKTHAVLAQSSDQPVQTESKNDEINLDTQLHLIIASHEATDEATRLPETLAPVLKQLRATLPFKHYRLATTLLNRVRNEGRLSLNWVGGLLVESGASTPVTPGFNEFRVNGIRIITDKDGKQMIRMDGFRFGARIPIRTYAPEVASNAAPGPVIVYETTGLNTDISMREGEPVIVGTMNVGPTGEAIVVVVSAKRSGN